MKKEERDGGRQGNIMGYGMGWVGGQMIALRNGSCGMDYNLELPF